MNNEANGRNLKRERLLRLESQQQVADSVGISKMSICSYENGKRVPRDDIKERLARHFGKSVQELFFTH